MDDAKIAKNGKPNISRPSGRFPKCWYKGWTSTSKQKEQAYWIKYRT